MVVEFLKVHSKQNQRLIMQKRNLASKMAYLEQIVEVVRKRSNVSIGEVSITVGLSFSTLYHYADLVTVMYPDIGFSNKRFFVISDKETKQN